MFHSFSLTQNKAKRCRYNNPIKNGQSCFKVEMSLKINIKLKSKKETCELLVIPLPKIMSTIIVDILKGYCVYAYVITYIDHFASCQTCGSLEHHVM